MKSKIYFFISFVLFSVGLSAQTKKYTVVLFSGDTIVCDYVVTGREFYYQIDGSKKVKLKWNELRYYTFDGGAKHTVTKENIDYMWLIENDSVVIGNTIRDSGTMDYVIFRKSNNETIEQIFKANVAIDDLKDYFGGNCPELDKKIIEYTPKFEKMKFPYKEWDELLTIYNQNCQK